MKRLLALFALFSLIHVGYLSAQQAPTKPKEIDILGQYLGNWTSEVTNKPAVWDKNGTKYKTLNHAAQRHDNLTAENFSSLAYFWNGLYTEFFEPTLNKEEIAWAGWWGMRL